MEVWQAAIVGLIQGVTEFLPISSSAHIVFSTHLLGVVEGGLRFTIIVHFGTLVAVFAALWYRIAPVVRGTLVGMGEIARGRSPWGEPDFGWGLYVIVGTIPAGVLGLAFEDAIAEAFASPIGASAFLMATGAILFATRFAGSGSRDMRWSSAIVVGFAQALAILPGISRSGTTIAAALLAGTDRRKAVEFSFLLSIPVILGPSLLTIGELATGPEVPLAPLAIGFLAAALAGYVSVRLLVRFVQQGRLSWFAYYCWLVGGLGVVLF